MGMTPEDRLWQQLLRQLDRIEAKLDTKVNYHAFNEFKQEADERMDKMEADLQALKEAALTPDQVTNLIGSKLQESEARGITTRERVVRYLVALASLATFTLLLYETLRP